MDIWLGAMSATGEIAADLSDPLLQAKLESLASAREGSTIKHNGVLFKFFRVEPFGADKQEEWFLKPDDFGRKPF